MCPHMDAAPAPRWHGGVAHVPRSFLVTACAQRVLQLLRDTEVAVRAFQRSHKWREAAKVGTPTPLLPRRLHPDA